MSRTNHGRIKSVTIHGAQARWTPWRAGASVEQGDQERQEQAEGEPEGVDGLVVGGWAGGELGDQVGQGDVEEVASRERQQHRHLHLGGQGVGDQGADQDGGGRGQVVRQGGPPPPAAVDQDAEVAQLLGDLVGGGKRLVRDDGSCRQLRLVDRRVTTTGAILAIYVPEE
jgi:hypothetical protein